MAFIGIDIRTLLTPYKTGIGEYTFELLNEIFETALNHHYYLFSNAYKKTSFPIWNKPNIHYINTHYPNKLLHSLMIMGKVPKIDTFITRKAGIKKLDLFFSPHFNFTPLSLHTPHILTIHDISFEFFPHFFSKKQQLWHKLIQPKKQAHIAHTIITPSFNTKRDLIHHYRLEDRKIEVLYPGTSIKNTGYNDQLETYNQKKYNLPDDYIFFLGTNEPRKNIWGIIKAFELVHAKLPKAYTLVLAGSVGWKNKKLYEYIKYSPLSKYIKLVGYIDDEEKKYFFKKAALFVYPSFYEGFGFPVLEALTLGCPTITSNRSSLPEIVATGSYLVNPHLPTSIAIGIYTVLQSNAIRNELVQKGREQVRQFTWKNTVEKWVHIIEQII